MKSEGKVRRKLQQVIWRHQSKVLKDNFRRVPCRCKHNDRVASVSGKEVGVCRFTPPEGVKWSVVVCDDDMPECLSTAKGCPHLESRLTKDEAKGQFVLHMQDLLNRARDGEMGPLVAEYPDVGSLLWVLYDGPVASEAVASVDEEASPKEPGEVEGDGEDDDEDEGSEVPEDEVDDVVPVSDLGVEGGQSDSVSASTSSGGEVGDPQESGIIVETNYSLAHYALPWWRRVLVWFMFWRREATEE